MYLTALSNNFFRTKNDNIAVSVNPRDEAAVQSSGGIRVLTNSTRKATQRVPNTPSAVPNTTPRMRNPGSFSAPTGMIKLFLSLLFLLLLFRGVYL